MNRKRHRWKVVDEHTSKCRDCSLRRTTRRVSGGAEWAHVTDWSWTRPNSDGETYRRKNGATPACPPSAADFLPEVESPP